MGVNAGPSEADALGNVRNRVNTKAAICVTVKAIFLLNISQAGRDELKLECWWW